MIPNQPLIVNLKDSPDPITIESLCVNCENNGETIMLMTKIPFFKEILLTSFNCQECGNRNNQVQFVGELPSRGIIITFKVTKKEDLCREVIKSEHATIQFTELGLEIPACKKAQITTIEGILLRVEEQLGHGQCLRKINDEQNYNKIEEFIKKLQSYRAGQLLPFYIKITDPSGNSNIKNPYAPKLDENILMSYPARTLEQIQKMGYSHENALQQVRASNKSKPMQKKENTQVYEQPKKMDFNQPLSEQNFMAYQPSIMEIDCHVCQMPGQMKTCSTSIPYFSDLIIMSFSCQYCGAHTTESKNSGQVSDYASTMTLNVKKQFDLKRDLFKSQTCKIIIPQIELELDYGTLGGVFTTVEGLLQKIQSHFQQLNGYTDSDSNFCLKMKQLIHQIEKMMNFERKFTLIMRDPLSRSFLQNPFHPEDDVHTEKITDQRTEEQIEFLGFDGLNV